MHQTVASRVAPLVFSYLSSKEATEFDRQLMELFSTDQLMELAGLSVAQIIDHHYQHDTSREMLVICGPGNNGGDGLVCARHLKMFGYPVEVVYPKQTDKSLYKALVRQIEACQVPLKASFSTEFLTPASSVKPHIVVDAMFGYSFQGEPKEPFLSIIDTLNTLKRSGSIDTVSVDIPSGWNVDTGASGVNHALLSPTVLVSLMLPKCGVKGFSGGAHYLGGRFVPPAFAKERAMEIPQFPGYQGFVCLNDI